MSDTPIKTCVLLESPDETPRPASTPIPSADVAPTPPPLPSLAAAPKGKEWQPGQVLRVHFMDGDPVVQAKVEAVTHEWSRYANIRFRFVNDPSAEIRISFQQPGSWSYIGTDAKRIARNKPTMNYGWLTPRTSDDEYERVVLHEFGHALGLIHEHQNPAVDIPWNRETVYQYYSGPPNNWSRSQVDTNLFQPYSAALTNYTEFDPDSIMLYPIPNDFTVGDFEVGWNKTLSDTDKWFVGQMYPKPENELLVDGPPRVESIGDFGEIDVFTFLAIQPGRYRMETEGRTDLVMSLFGPDDDGLFMAEDDDSGRRLNPRIVTDLDRGKYTLRVRHFSTQRTGDYTIFVVTEPNE